LVSVFCAVFGVCTRVRFWSQIALAASYRSKARLPAATWLDPVTGAVLARASQPLAGMNNKRSAEDVLLLEALRVANRRGSTGSSASDPGSSSSSSPVSSPVSSSGSDGGAGSNGLVAASGPPLYIADCRGKVAVQGNQLQGKGAEDVRHYTNTQLLFCDILNIHTMRDSQAALVALLSPDALVAAAPPPRPAPPPSTRSWTRAAG
jgi:hypothetical protein